MLTIGLETNDIKQTRIFLKLLDRSVRMLFFNKNI